MAVGLVSAEGFAVDTSLIPADAIKQHAAPSSDWKSEEINDEACHATRKYLATFDDAAFGAATQVSQSSFRCPTRRPSGLRRSRAPPSSSYSTNYLIDTDHGVIVDVEATRSIRQAEVGAPQTMSCAKIDLLKRCPRGTALI